jgi:hypothetical protein
MKKVSKTQMYSKMYLITPMVYEKIKQHLDKSDRTAITNVNKPYFTPKIEFNGSPFNPQNPINLSPFYTPRPNYPQNPLIEPKQEEGEEMDWKHSKDMPILSEIETQTDPTQTGEMTTQTYPFQPSEMSTQTEQFPYSEIETQTEQAPIEHQQTQTDKMPVGHQQTQTTISTGEQATQTTPILRKVIPLETTGTQTEIIPQKEYSSMGTQTTKKRKKKTNIPKQVVTQETVVSSIPSGAVLPMQSRALVPIQSQVVSNIPKKTVSILKRKPIRINIPPELRTNLSTHSTHYGQPIIRGIPPLPITHQEYPVSIQQERAVAPTRDPLYYVETPHDEPPGEKTEGEIVSPLKIIKTYSRKRPHKKFIPTTSPFIFGEGTEDIDLPVKKSKKSYSCDLCGAVLSSNYNLKRHKEREMRRIQGFEPTTADVAVEQNPQFASWSDVKIPSKRSSSEAKLTTQTYRKRKAVSEKGRAINFDQWSSKTPPSM